MILAIDPGTYESAYLFWDTEKENIESMGIKKNDDVLKLLKDCGNILYPSYKFVIEMIESRGMPIGKETIETIFWIGRFWEAFEGDKEDKERVYRREVKLHFCGTVRATDANIRQVLIDRFGGIQSTKKGGKLYGVKSHIWSALALALCHAEKTENRE